MYLKFNLKLTNRNASEIPCFTITTSFLDDSTLRKDFPKTRAFSTLPSSKACVTQAQSAILKTKSTVAQTTNFLLLV